MTTAGGDSVDAEIIFRRVLEAEPPHINGVRKTHSAYYRHSTSASIARYTPPETELARSIMRCLAGLGYRPEPRMPGDRQAFDGARLGRSPQGRPYRMLPVLLQTVDRLGDRCGTLANPRAELTVRCPTPSSASSYPRRRSALEAFAKRTQQIGRELAAPIVIPRIELPPLPTDFIRRMQGIAERMAESVRRAWPPNWEDDGWDTAVMLARMDIIDTEGLPLVWVPRSSLVVDLTDQEDADTRTELLLDRADDALDACDEQLCHVDDADLAPVTDGVARALDARRGGHPEAAQALATAALDTTITRSYGLGSRAAGREFDVALEEVPIGIVRQAWSWWLCTGLSSRSTRSATRFPRGTTGTPPCMRSRPSSIRKRMLSSRCFLLPR